MDNKDFEIKEMNIGSDSEKIRPKENKIGPDDNPSKGKMRGLISLFNKKNLPKALILVFLFVVILILTLFVVRGGKPDPDKVKISIRIPNSVSSGEEMVLKVDYANDNRVGLKNVYLTIDYPPGTFSIDGKELNYEKRDLGVVEKKSQGTEEFKTRFVGEKGDSKNITASLNFVFENFSSPFEKETTSRLEINSVLISINIEGPEKSIAGEEVNYLIEYENKTNEDIRDLNLELSYDKDFKFKSAEPSPKTETNNIWEIPALKAGEKRSINLIGDLKGKEGESKILKVVVGRIENDQLIQYGQSEYLTLVSPSPIILQLAIDGTREECLLNPGQSLRYKVYFKNNTDVALTELILKAHLEDSVFDLKTIQIGEIGFFDSRENTIIWSGADIPALKMLEPNQSGEVSFLIRLKEPVPMNNYNDRNRSAEVSAEIGTRIIPDKFAVSELNIYNDSSCKINSKVDLKSKVYYYEPSAGINNFGPIPPKVDMLTDFTVHWQISNGSNDLEGIKVYSVLPQGIEWKNTYVNKVSDSVVSYNERTKEITWEIKKVPAGAGRLTPIYELVFQIAIRPSTNQIGTAPDLVNEASLEAKDSFTGVILKDYAGSVNTSIPDDSRARGGTVVQ